MVLGIVVTVVGGSGRPATTRTATPLHLLLVVENLGDAAGGSWTALGHQAGSALRLLVTGGDQALRRGQICHLLPCRNLLLIEDLELGATCCVVCVGRNSICRCRAWHETAPSRVIELLYLLGYSCPSHEAFLFLVLDRMMADYIASLFRRVDSLMMVSRCRPCVDTGRTRMLLVPFKDGLS